MSTENNVNQVKYLDPAILVPGQKIKQTVHLMVSSYGSISISTFKYQDYIYIGEAEVEFTVPEGFNAVAQAVAAIDNKIEAIQDEAQKRLRPLREQKAQLLQISYAGAEILDAVKDPLYKGNHEQR